MNIFIDTEDMEERYGEQLYQDYLVEQNKDLQQRIDKALTKIDNMFNNGDEYTIIDDLLELDKILKGDSNEHI